MSKQDHKRWRKEFNQSCLKRDGYKCKFCNVTDNLDVHHITNRHLMPNAGYSTSNGITVCSEHHLLCEIAKNDDLMYSPTKLYELIGSSYEQAFSDSFLLK